ncbi:MAG: serine--tRNA ligase, partial [Burkholderiaceae bacterium]
MIDLQLLRKDTQLVADRLAARRYVLDVETFNALEARRKSVQVRTEQIQASRNTLSKQIGQAKAKGEDASDLMAQAADLPNQLSAAEAELSAIQSEMEVWLSSIPNLPHESVPVGSDEHGNVEVRRWGQPAAF